jgi:hypothetical protein
MEGVTFESVRAYLYRAEEYIRPNVYQAIERALTVAEREQDHAQRDYLYELIRGCASPFSNRAAMEAYMNRAGRGFAREIISELLR